MFMGQFRGGGIGPPGLAIALPRFLSKTLRNEKV